MGKNGKIHHVQNVKKIKSLFLMGKNGKIHHVQKVKMENHYF